MDVALRRGASAATVGVRVTVFHAERVLLSCGAVVVEGDIVVHLKVAVLCRSVADALLVGYVHICLVVLFVQVEALLKRLSEGKLQKVKLTLSVFILF